MSVCVSFLASGQTGGMLQWAADEVTSAAEAATDDKQAHQELDLAEEAATHSVCVYIAKPLNLS